MLGEKTTGGTSKGRRRRLFSLLRPTQIIMTLFDNKLSNSWRLAIINNKATQQKFVFESSPVELATSSS
jgi:hypothetical protein